MQKTDAEGAYYALKAVAGLGAVLPSGVPLVESETWANLAAPLLEETRPERRFSFRLYRIDFRGGLPIYARDERALGAELSVMPEWDSVKVTIAVVQNLPQDVPERLDADELKALGGVEEVQDPT